MSVLLAPMAGITDPPFRSLVAKFGAGLLVSEMIASREVLASPPSAEDLGLLEDNTSVQLAGCDPEPVAEAARLVEGLGAKIIDINMGCPAKKVVGGWSGAALMRDPDSALRIVEAVVKAVSVPVTLKMRLGWDGTSLNAPQIAVRAEGAGVTMIAVHGRTRCQFYSGHADWNAIRKVVEAVDIPVIANGDVDGTISARSALARSGAAGIMIGRAARGQPWMLSQVAAEISGRPAPAAPSGSALRELVAEHYDAMLSFYGREVGRRVARKHIGWYLGAAGADPAFRSALLTMEEPALVSQALRNPWPQAEEGRAA